MSLKDFKSVNITELYRVTLLLSNWIAALGAILTAIYLIMPLFGAKISFAAIIAYASWVGLGLGIRPLLKKKIKYLKAGVYEYVMACIFVIFSVIVWWRFPVNAIFGILIIAGFAYSYKAQNNL
ncbi:MAG: hypothetical protein WC404_03325 [Candidatus Omnitrophota bacterium]|jgi:hypothetical protein